MVAERRDLTHNHFIGEKKKKKEKKKLAKREALHERIFRPLTGEQVVVILPQFDGSLVELPGALPGLWTQSGPHVLHALLIIRI